MRRITRSAGYPESKPGRSLGLTAAWRSRLGRQETNSHYPRQSRGRRSAVLFRLSGCAVVVGLLTAAAGLNAANPNTADRDLVFAVKVYNYADVSPKTLLEAKRHAAKVYRKIGISTTWVDCPFKPEQAHNYPECAALGNGPSVLNLQILSKEMIEKLGFNTKTFGFALPTRGRKFAVRANVFAHRVEALAYLGRPSKAEILGYVMAHELGHLFLGPGSHASSGLMGFPWGKRRLRMAAEGSLKFTGRQGEQIRAEVRDRLAGD